jgi:hypothetical protein
MSQKDVISTLVRQCLDISKDLETDAQETPSSLIDELGRFRVWVGNISAHRTFLSRRSLEYRLRDSSNLRSTVVGLLRDLLQLLQNVHSAITSGEGSVPNNGVETEGLEEEDLELSDSDSDDEASALDRTIEEIHEVINCLLRFSMALRNPARHDQLKRSGAISTAHFEPYDIDHVRHKFPLSAFFLHQRLGKAISRHRQYFKYRSEHRAKLARGMDDFDDDATFHLTSTVATSLYQTDALNHNLRDDMDDDTASMYTATSFAPTTIGEGTLRPPPLPEKGYDKEPFECPICFSIVSVENERSWR